MYMTVLKYSRDTLMECQRRLAASPGGRGSYVMRLDDGEFMHRWVTSQFHCRRDEGGLLYRVIRKRDASWLYIQSADPFMKADLDRTGMELASETELGAPAASEPVIFSIVCTPVREKLHGKAFIADPAERKAWLMGKLGGCMDMMSMDEIRTLKLSVKGPSGDKSRHAMGAAEYAGIAEVKDPELFMETVARGIGKAKNYGAGLLLYAPIR